MSELFIGLMSGTSMDGIDAALVDFTNDKSNLIATHNKDIPAEIKKRLNSLLTEPHITLQHYGECDTAMGKLFADASNELIQQANITKNEVTAIGSHGQTIYHQPTGEHPFTLQIGDPNIIAAKTGITTIADFRRRDMAHLGQGAPLAPVFHQYLFQQAKQDTVVLNIGGIANITLLPADTTQAVIGFDTGPGNTLLDQWCKQHTGSDYDKQGAWARSGKINTTLLTALLSDPYFKQPAPKSTGREYFNRDWLSKYLTQHSLSPEDVQATLTELTAVSINDAVPPTAEIIVCGGGANNTYLIERLSHHCDTNTIKTSNTPEWIEAMAFAWLAKNTLEKKSLPLSTITGAKTNDILGGIYPTVTK